MRIKKIEIDGFKSYAQRVVIDGFDKQFNAITGLNGSGKSNILDSICFVLGITNLSQVRAQQLSDLVYKQGQAGITKATVTITFDNTDPNCRPVGYDKYSEIIVRRQIIINGRNTYTINGTMATNARVADMFRSVGLNVNNPHFLIMQGRITKVLNMKPVEILSMIEEAAGVRMYETKKQSSLRTIEKKDGKVQEIKKLMEEDILPKVEKLKRDRNNYLEYQKIGRDIDNLKRKLLAFDYANSQALTEKYKNLSTEKERELEEISREIKAITARIEQLKEEYDQMEQQKATRFGNEKTQLEETVKELQKRQNEVESSRDAKKDANKALKTQLDRLLKSLNSDKKELEKKIKDLEKMENENGGQEQRGKAAEEKLQKSRAKMEALAKGMTTDEDGNAVTLEGQLTNLRSELSVLETNVKKAEMKLNQLLPLLDKKKKELSGMATQATSEEQEKKQLEATIKRIETELKRMNFDEEAQNQLEQERRNLGNEQRDIKRQTEEFENQYHHLQLRYRDPYPNFDRSKVKGLVAKLFRVKDMRYATALEVVAGGALYNIVIDSSETGTQLLNNNCMQNRVTFMPLNKFQPRNLDQRILTTAQTILKKDKETTGEEKKVYVAKQLIEYEPYLEPIMSNIFGGTLICPDMGSAKRLCFDPAIKTRVVTLAGEDFKPDGVLTGGSRPKSSLLQDLNQFLNTDEELNRINVRIREVEAELRRLQPLRQQYDNIKTESHTATRRLEAIRESLKHSPVQILQDEIVEIEREIPTHQQVVENSRDNMARLKAKVNELENRKKNEKAFQDKEKKQAQKDYEDAQKELSDLKGSFEKIKEILNSLRDEIAKLKEDIANDEAQVEQLRSQLSDGSIDIEESDKAVNEAKENVKKAQTKLDTFLKQLRDHDKDMRAKQTMTEDLKKNIQQLGTKKDTIFRESCDYEKKIDEYTKRGNSLEKKNEWIATEKKNFGKAGTAYDFKDYNLEVGEQQIKEKEKRKEVLGSTINAKAMALLGNAEEKCMELEKKRAQLEKDKQQLLDAIKELDRKKEREVIEAHRRVTEDFNNIFSSLLPGTNAKLVPPQGQTVLQGLEVKIAFNKQWKESLGELSGGQRSLVALSLILAMLKFKPAPLYILDEVDAALDLSHTQNIGTMIKKHFTESQRPNTTLVKTEEHMDTLSKIPVVYL